MGGSCIFRIPIAASRPRGYKYGKMQTDCSPTFMNWTYFIGFIDKLKWIGYKCFHNLKNINVISVLYDYCCYQTANKTILNQNKDFTFLFTCLVRTGCQVKYSQCMFVVGGTTEPGGPPHPHPSTKKLWRHNIRKLSI